MSFIRTDAPTRPDTGVPGRYLQPSHSRRHKAQAEPHTRNPSCTPLRRSSASLATGWPASEHGLIGLVHWPL
nr:MAG TPA: hypothetical protein [Caudoviricetes sp.]